MSRRPKTKPTGFVPPGARRSPPPEEFAAAEPNPDDVRVWRLKVAYRQERSRWETLKQGKTVTYKPAKLFDGRGALAVDGDKTAVVESAKDSVWRKILQWCDAMEVNPEEYVRICFQNLPLDITHPPEPSHLPSRKFADKWEDLYADMEDRIKNTFELEKKTAITKITVAQKVHGDSPEESQVRTLTSSVVPLGPLFRYCLATSIGTPRMRKVADVFHAEAILQFECFRTFYRRVYGEWLPQGFSKESRELYPRLLGMLWERQQADDK